MFRASASQIARRVKLSSSSRQIPSCLIGQQHGFHATGRRDETTKDVAAPTEEPSTGFWQPIYAIPLGIAFAVPAIKYEWYLVNEETQLAACMMAFTMLVYKNFGGMLHSYLEEDGKRILEDHNKAEDYMIRALEDKKQDIIFQERIVDDAKDILALQKETYEILDAVGKSKPSHEFKSQVERVLSIIETEEANMLEKAKVSLMEEATASVTSKLLTDKTLQKASLDTAIAQLTGSPGGKDVVKDAFLDFFKTKAAAPVDEVAEVKLARENIVMRLNAIASNEGFYFRFDADGTPKMIA